MNTASQPGNPRSCSGIPPNFPRPHLSIYRCWLLCQVLTTGHGFQKNCLLKEEICCCSKRRWECETFRFSLLLQSWRTKTSLLSGKPSGRHGNAAHHTSPCSCRHHWLSFIGERWCRLPWFYWKFNVSAMWLRQIMRGQSEWGDRNREWKVWNLAKFQVVQRKKRIRRTEGRGRCGRFWKRKYKEKHRPEKKEETVHLPDMMSSSQCFKNYQQRFNARNLLSDHLLFLLSISKGCDSWQQYGFHWDHQVFQRWVIWFYNGESWFVIIVSHTVVMVVDLVIICQNGKSWFGIIHGESFCHWLL